MSYRFLEPRIAPDTEGGTRPNAARPEVYTCSGLDGKRCGEIAGLITAAHQAGQSWESRTRYAPQAQAQWDVNRKFRSSKNLSPVSPGLEDAYEALERGAMDAFPSLGLDPAISALRRVDDQCLIYTPGDHIGDHADNSASETGDDGQPLWHVIKPQRHVVAVMWLTTQTQDGTGEREFAGGTLRFNSLVHEETGEPLDVRPTAGLMVVFPATAWFRHEVLRVEAGLRLAVTRWWEVVAKPLPTPAGSA